LGCAFAPRQAVVVKPIICPLPLTVRLSSALPTVGKAANEVSVDGRPALSRRNW
jgi:hypothetical protein